MKPFTKILLTIVATASLLLAGMTLLYARELSEGLTSLRRESRSDIVYLRSRLRDLEGELQGKQADTAPTVGEALPETDATGDESLPEVTSPVAGTENIPSEEATEAMTLPVHHSPETTPEETVGETTAAYLLCEHEGIIGIFNDRGELLRRVNVLVMTLPRADREALSAGIPVYSESELERLLESYE